MRARVTAQVHQIVGQTNLLGKCAIDATVGNGFDTVFLAREVGPGGLVIGFDVQLQALASAKERLKSDGLLDRVKLVHDSHDRLARYLPLVGRSDVIACLFNLGYLPGSDKSVVTKPYTTIRALATVSDLLMPKGLISIVAYTGHGGGREEADSVRDWAAKLPADQFAVMRPRVDLAGNRTPELTIIQRKDVRLTSCA